MMKKNPLANGTGRVAKLKTTALSWPLRAIAVATLATIQIPDAAALALGQIRVLSALGEPLRAEIDLTQISAEDASTLKAGIPASSAFQAAGVDYNPALSTARLVLEQRPNGRYVLRLSSDRAINEPFVDLIVETSWASGRIVRDYTLLFDPPPTRPAPVAVTAAPQIKPAEPTEAAASRIASSPRAAPARPAVAASPTPKPAVAPSKEPANEKPASGPGESTITVKGGDTAAKLALASKLPGVSLDQMLVAMLQANPDAFIGGNVNRLKAGALIDMPTAAQAEAVTPAEARKTVLAQSLNFNEFRRKLAEQAPATRVAAADRQASGTIQTNVDDKKPTATTPDKLTLSKGNVSAAKSGEAQIAQARQTKDASQRAAELSKNISDLSRLQASASGATAPASASSGAKAVSLSVPSLAPAASSAKPTASSATGIAGAASAPAAAAASTAKPALTTTSAASAPTASAARPAASAASAAAGPASSPVSASSAQVPVSAVAAASSAVPAASAAASGAAAPASAPPAPTPAPKPKVAAPPPPPEPSFMDELLENPLVPAGAVGLVALLAGFGFYRARQRKKAGQVDSSFLESRLQPDSFFGSSGGQRIDTSDNSTAASSMVYSPSQLDAAGDVDPVAEADVYLAYGRDLQAEEILKEALKVTPNRVAIHSKLLEIYGKRRDLKAFEAVAAEAYRLTGGTGPEWERIGALGLEADPGNAMYRPGGQPTPPPVTAPPVAPSFAASTMPVQVELARDAAPEMSVDLDLGDLDFSAEPVPVAQAPKPIPAQQPAAVSSPSTEPDGLDFALDEVAMPPIPAPAAAPRTSPASSNSGSGMIEFDLGSLSLDLEQEGGKPDMTPPAPAGGSLTSGDLDAMDTKLALAQEFHSIGDGDAARALVREVIAEASGPLKAKAQRFLAELG